MPASDNAITDREFTPEEIKEFQNLIKAEYGVELSEGDAIVMVKRLMSLYEIMARPLPGDLGGKVSSSSFAKFN